MSKYAEENPDQFHGVSKFDLETGKAIKFKSDDYSKVTGKTCYTDTEHHSVIETVGVNFSVVKAPTCEEEGIGRYTAVFDNEMLEDQIKDIILPTLFRQLYPKNFLKKRREQLASRKQKLCHRIREMF